MLTYGPKQPADWRGNDEGKGIQHNDTGIDASCYLYVAVVYFIQEIELQILRSLWQEHVEETGQHTRLMRLR